MMKKILGIGCVLLFAAATCWGEVMLSPLARMEKNRAAQKSVNGLTRSFSEDKLIGIYLEVESDRVLELLRQKSYAPVEHKENILTMKCRLSELDSLCKIPGIKRIQLSAKPHARLNRTVYELGAQTAYNGIGDPKSFYTGEGVIVGIIDFGFDLGHPAFYDLNGNSRITRLWDQTKLGTAPSGYTYGAEYKDANVIQRVYTSDEYHGTHVAGIAAGKGIGTNLQYQGMAPKANLVLVELNGSESDVVDAIKYIFDYATSVQKPAVINMSLGTHMGPHDGTSYMDRMIDSYTGAGKIIVGAAGNEGYLPMHISKVFTAQSKMHTVMDFWEDGNDDKQNYVDIWSKKDASPFNWKIMVYDTLGTKLGQTATKSTSSARTTDYITIGTDIVEVQTETEKNSYNKRTNVFMSVVNPQMNVYKIVLEIEAANDTIHMWNLAYDQSGMTFSTLPVATGLNWVDGDQECTVGEIGGTAKRIISVGALRAYPLSTSSGFNYVDYYSSLGPTRDGRIKPDIVAPGTAIVAPVNSYASGLPPTRFSTVFNSRTYTYGSLSGTSMAAPHVTGAVALFLQKDRTLTPEAVKTKLASCAYSLESMGTLPNNTWGNGILRVLGYLQTDAPVISNLEFRVYPNPSQGYFYVKAPADQPYSIEVYSMQGNLVYRKDALGTSAHQIACVAGNYAVIIRCGKHVESHMLMIGNPR